MSDRKPKFALIIRTPPPPDYMRFNESLYADRTINNFIPQWRNQVSWRIIVHPLPGSPSELQSLISKQVKEYDFDGTIISEFVDTEGHNGILVQVFD